MFKKLKEKIAEEVKQSPLKISQLAQSVVSPSSSSAVEATSNDNFSISDETPQDSPGREGFTVVDLHHPSVALPPPGGRISRQSSMSSLASDVSSAFFSLHDSSLGVFNMQMDLESASEKEDVLPQLNNVSKQELYNAYMKLHRHYQKYKGRAHDFRNYCRELDKDNKKHKAVLLECQEKSLRRMAELKEQCALEQHAKAHLEEALRNDLEEKDHLIQTLQTKIKLLRDAHSANSAIMNLSFPENIADLVDLTENSNDHTMNMPDSEEKNRMCDVIGGGDQNENTVFQSKKEWNENDVHLVSAEIKGDDVGTEKRNIEEFHNGNCEDLLLLGQLIVKHERFFDSMHKLAETFEAAHIDQEHGEEQRRIAQSALFDVLNEMHTLGDESYIETTMPTTGELQHIQIKINNQMKYLGKILLNASQIYKNMSDAVTSSTNAKCSNEAGGELREVTEELNVTQKNVEDALNQNHQLNEALIKLENQLETLKIDNKKLSEEMTCMKTEIEESEFGKAHLRDELVATRKHLEESVCKKDELCKALHDTEIQLRKVKEEAKETEKKMRNEEGIRHSIILAEKLEEMNAQRIDVQKYEKELFELTEEHCKLTEQLSVAQKNAEENIKLREKLASENNRVKEVMSDNCELSERVANLQGELNNLQEMCQHMQQESSHVMNELVSTKKDLEESTSEKAELKHRVQILQEELVQYKEKICAMEEELTSAQKREGETCQKLDEVEKALHMKTKLSELVDDIQKELTGTKMKCELVTEELEETQQKLKENHSIQMLMKEEILATQRSLEGVKGEKEVLINSRTDLQQSVDEAKKKNEELRAELTSALAEMTENNAKHMCLQEEFTATCKSLEEVLSEQRVLKESFSNLKKENDEDKQKYEAIVQELSLAHKRLKEYDSGSSQNQNELINVMRNFEESKRLNGELNEKLESYQCELKLFKEKYKHTSDELAVVTKSIEDSNVKINHLEAELVMTQNNAKEVLSINTKLEKVRNELEVQCNNMQEELCLANEKMSCMGMELETIQKNLEETTREKVELNNALVAREKQLQESSLNNQQLTDEVTLLKTKIEENECGSTQLRNEVVRVEGHLEEAVQQRDELEKALNASQAQLGELKQSFESVSEELQKQMKGSSHLRTELVAVRVELEEATCKKTELNELLANCQTELNILKKEYDHVSKEFSVSQKTVEEMSKLTAELNEELTCAKMTLEGVLTEKTELSETVIDLQGELNRSVERCQLLQEELEKMQKKDKDYSHAISELELTKKDLEEVKACVVDLEASLCACNTELGVITGEKNKILEELLTLQKGAEESARINSNLEHELTSIQKDLDEATMLGRKLQETVIVLEKQRDELKENSMKQISEAGNRSEVSTDKDLVYESVLPDTSSCAFEASGIGQASLSAVVTQVNERKEHISQVGGVQSLFDEYQKEVEEHESQVTYKSETHRPVDSNDRLSGSANIESTELLRHKILDLSCELQETKEKYKMQMANFNRHARKQSESSETDYNKNSIEMEYLKNIMYQYMMGKEPMLLAKVISAVMKFDQEQVEQIMQKEVHKQTLLGQLGIL